MAGRGPKQYPAQSGGAGRGSWGRALLWDSACRLRPPGGQAHVTKLCAIHKNFVAPRRTPASSGCAARAGLERRPHRSASLWRPVGNGTEHRLALRIPSDAAFAAELGPAGLGSHQRILWAGHGNIAVGRSLTQLVAMCTATSPPAAALLAHSPWASRPRALGWVCGRWAQAPKGPMPMDKMTKQELWILTAVSLAPIPLLTVVALLVAL